MDGIYLLIVLEKLEIFQHIKSLFPFLLLENWRMMDVRAEQLTSQFFLQQATASDDLSSRINKFVFAPPEIVIYAYTSIRNKSSSLPVQFSRNLFPVILLLQERNWNEVLTYSYLLFARSRVQLQPFILDLLNSSSSNTPALYVFYPVE
jgi:hypothetical protein